MPYTYYILILYQIRKYLDILSWLLSMTQYSGHVSHSKEDNLLERVCFIMERTNENEKKIGFVFQCQHSEIVVTLFSITSSCVLLINCAYCCVQLAHVRHFCKCFVRRLILFKAKKKNVCIGVLQILQNLCSVFWIKWA